jgi:ankyrin repeat protein
MNDGEDELKSLIARCRRRVPGKIDVVKLLPEWGEDINSCNASNEIPLDRAAAKGLVDVVRLLIERGAEVDPCE